MSDKIDYKTKFEAAYYWIKCTPEDTKASLECGSIKVEQNKVEILEVLDE